MKCFRTEVIKLVFMALCIAVLGIVGCAKAPESSSVKSPAAGESSVPADGIKQLQAPSTAPITEERVYYDFENDLNGWEVPIWAQGKSDYVGKSVESTGEMSKHGDYSMKLTADFPGDMWTAALVEIEQYLNLSPYRVVTADIYLPKEAPIGLKAKLILTVGNNWKFVEMSRSIPLIPGEWVILSANIEPGSYDWKRVVPDEEFAQDVRKIAIRLESNRKPRYSGPIYIDNIRCGR